MGRKAKGLTHKAYMLMEGSRLPQGVIVLFTMDLVEGSFLLPLLTQS
jgi:hypothetical protein